LPYSSLISKQAEIENALKHLGESNTYIEDAIKTEGDDDGELKLALQENGAVVERMKQRLELVKFDIERRKQDGSCMAEADEAMGLGPGIVRLNGNTVSENTTSGRSNGHTNTQNEDDTEENEQGVHL
jgi:hypothetical protein